MAKTSKELTNIQEELRKELDTLKDRVDPPSGFMISTKGKQFTLPNGSSDSGPLNCIILDWVSANSYFAELYNPKDPQPPACFAIGRLVTEMEPSENSPDLQSEDCASCKQNIWGTDPQGGKGKACKNTRRLLVAPVDAEESAQPWVLSVSPTGLKHFDKYVNTLGDLGTHPIEVATAISFQADEAYPSLRFKVLEKHDNLNLMWRLKEAGQEILIQEPKFEKAA